MSEILKVYTADQLYEMYRKLILAKGIGLTDFNDGSKIKTLIQSNSDIISSISMEFKEGIYNAIPVALFEGFNFPKKEATGSTGYLKLYRKPVFTLRYTGAATSVLLTTTGTGISAACVGAPGDAFSFTYAAYPQVTDLVAAIEALTNWTATKVKDAATNLLYQYAGVELLSKFTYVNAIGMDICLASDVAILIPTGYSVTIEEMDILTVLDYTLPAGESWINCSGQNSIVGIAGNIKALALDTANGKGTINSTIVGIENVVNDTAFSGGAEAETDEERRIRFINTVNALNAGTKNGIIVAIEGITGVRSAGMRTSYPFRGTNTLIVDDGTGTISASLRAAVEKVLYGDASDLDNFPGKNAEGIGYIIEAPSIQDVDIGITATRLSTVKVSLDEIKADIQSAVEQYINTLQLGRDVLLSEIVRVAKNSNSAIYDLEVTSPSANIIINDNQFARTGAGTTGSVTVTVTIATSE